MSEGATKLQYALKNLRIRWEAAKADWNDAVSQEFEDKHLAPLETSTDRAMRGMQQLFEILAKARRDCS